MLNLSQIYPQKTLPNPVDIAFIEITNEDNPKLIPLSWRKAAWWLFIPEWNKYSIPVPKDNYFEQLKVLSVANMLGEAIWRVHEESSISSMFR